MNGNLFMNPLKVFIEQELQEMKRGQGPSKDSLVLNYGADVVFISFKDKNPEENLIVKTHDKFYLFTGDKEKTKSVIE